jgi:hypothetical protein
MWANVQRECFDAELLRAGQAGRQAFEASVKSYVSVLKSHEAAWYAFLFTVIEACLDEREKRQLIIRGIFRSEIDAMYDTLRLFRNAVFHVSRDKYYDDRLLDLYTRAETGADKIRRVHDGFGRLFLDESAARNPRR